MRVSKPGVSAAIACLALTAAFLLPATAEAKKKAAAKSDFTSDVIANFTRVAKQLVDLAEATPADKFSWRPTDKVRKVSEVYMHIVGANDVIPVLLGAAPPKGVTMPEKPFDLFAKLEAEVTAKDEVIARLRESFDYAIAAVKGMSQEDLDAESQAFGFPASKRAYVLILMSHAHEHLGQSIAYARSVGVVPPWNAPKEAAAGK
ncbi:MAG TPA: DinB family protein [Candidatus Binatia bacterium]|nr:DinB family protein [Candidatus Binatia bacterium]